MAKIGLFKVHLVVILLFSVSCVPLRIGDGPVPPFVNSFYGGIRGRLVEEESGKPIRDATILIEPQGTAMVIGKAMVKTDANGYFRMAGLGPGEYMLRVGDIEYFTHIYYDIHVTANEWSGPNIDKKVWTGCGLDSRLRLPKAKIIRD